MTLRLLTWASADHATAAGDLGRIVSDRKVLRLVGERAAAPLRAASDAYDAAVPVPGASARTAVHTVSGWEETEGATSGNGHRSITPTGELRRMTTMPLCVIMLARHIRGPNAHWVGDGATVCHLLALVDDDLARGAADRTLVVAFDQDRAAPASVRAVATLVAGGDGDGGGTRLTVPPASSATGATACSTLERIAAESGQYLEPEPPHARGSSRA